VRQLIWVNSITSMHGPRVDEIRRRPLLTLYGGPLSYSWSLCIYRTCILALHWFCPGHFWPALCGVPLLLRRYMNVILHRHNRLPNFTQIGPAPAELYYDAISFLNGDRCTAKLLPVAGWQLGWWLHSYKKFEIYLHTTYFD